MAFGGCRTYHRIACAIEDAGWDIFQQLQWIFGSGFPKSLDISKAIDKAAGAEREVIGNTAETSGRTIGQGTSKGFHGDIVSGHCREITAPTTDAAKLWEGYGSDLKPAHEPICLARKPLDGTYAQNALKHGCGGLNIDECRVESGIDYKQKCDSVIGLDSKRTKVVYGKMDQVRESSFNSSGRWPANIIHDGSEEVLRGFPETSGTIPHVTSRPKNSFGFG